MDNILLQAVSEERVRAEREARQAARPSRNDNIIAAVIQAPANQRNADGAPALAPPLPYQPSAHPGVANPNQLLGPRVAVASGTGHGSQRRSALVAVSSGQEPPSQRPRTSDELVMGFQDALSQEAQYRYSSFIFGHLSVLNLCIIEHKRQKRQNRRPLRNL
jgi:hypothetical protein